MKISKSEFKKRVEAAQQKLVNQEIEALIVSQEEDIYYLTGLTFKSLERFYLFV